MIYLVLKDARRKAIDDRGHQIAVTIMGFDGDSSRTLDKTADVTSRVAPFTPEFSLVGALNDSSIHKRLKDRLFGMNVLPSENRIDDNESLRDADLWCGQTHEPHAGRLDSLPSRDGQHAVDQRLKNSSIDFVCFHFRSDVIQNRILRWDESKAGNVAMSKCSHMVPQRSELSRWPKRLRARNAVSVVEPEPRGVPETGMPTAMQPARRLRTRAVV